jgi:hypothetical protein
MYPASAAFRAAILQSHTVKTVAEVWTATGTKVVTLEIDSGAVNVDSTSAIRRTCSVILKTVRGASIIPTTVYDPLQPYGNELKLFRGVQYADGTTELTPLGVFVMRKVSFDDKSAELTLSVDGDDRSIKITRNKWTQPYTATAGSLTTALQAMILDRYPDATFDFPTIPTQILQQVFGQDFNNDPWKDAVTMAELAGYDLFFSPTGVVTLQQFPLIDAVTVDISYQENDSNVVLEVKRDDDVSQTYNGIIYVSEGSQINVPGRVEVWDNDVNSPTYRYGSFGQSPKTVSQSLIQDTDTMLLAATALLGKALGLLQGVSWIQIPNPALDVFDCVYLSNTGTNINRVLIVDKINIPLQETSTMQVTARTVRTVTSGAVTQGQAAS